MVTIDGVPEPAGGFKQGGWYNGRQYWNGTLSAPGVINSQSDQAGAGQAVSKEVVAQTNPNNVAYIQQQQQKLSSPSDLAASLDKFQQSTFASADVNAPKVATIDEMRAQLEPTTPKPTPINRVEEFNKLTSQYGVADLEKSLNDYKAQEAELLAQLRTDKAAERGKPVAQGVIEGRISEETRIAQENLDFISRQKSVITDQLNTKYNLISTMMNFMGLDYQDAVKAYDDEYNRNVNMYQLIQADQKTAFDQSMQLRNDAKANLQMFATAITNGNMSIESLSADQKLMLNKLEIQSGLPVGFVSSLKLSAKDRLINVNESTGEALVVGENGSFKVIQTGMRSAPTAANALKQNIQDLGRTLMEEAKRSAEADGKNDTFVSPEVYNKVKQVAVSEGIPAETFDNYFRDTYTEPSMQKEYGFRDTKTKTLQEQFLEGE